ncbi:MAG: tetratricopeptide repeat protein [Pseudomonadota bacterium]
MANTRLWAVDQDRPFLLAGRHIDPAKRTVTSDRGTATVEPRVLAVLLQLVAAPHETVRREHLIDAVWPGSPGAESSLSNAISLLRQALDDRGHASERLIRTIPKLGYRLTVEPQPLSDGSTSDQAANVVSVERSPTKRRWWAAAAVAAMAMVALILIQSDKPLVADPDRPDLVFIAMIPLEAADDQQPLAYGLARDANELLSRSGRYRVADTSEVYQVANGVLRADVEIRTQLAVTDDGIVATTTWIDTQDDDVLSLRRVEAKPGSVLKLRRDWLEAVVVETALAVSTVARKRPSSFASSGEPVPDIDQFLRQPPSENLEAYEAFLQGYYAYDQYTQDGLKRAIEHLEKALALDPQFAEAHSILGSVYLHAGSHQGFLPPVQARQKARDALLAAVTLRPDLVDARDALADFYNCIDRRPLLAMRTFEGAFQIDARMASSGYTRLLLLHDSPEAAIAQIERNLSRFPDSINWKLIAAQHFKAAGAFERALDEAKAAYELAPAMSEARLTRAKVLSVLGAHDEAVPIFEALYGENPHSARLGVSLVVGLARAQRLDEARTVLDGVLASGARASNSHLAMAFGWTGDVDQAFEYLEAALNEREFGLCYLATEPIYEPLRPDPRFAEILQRMRGAG